MKYAKTLELLKVLEYSIEMKSCHLHNRTNLASFNIHSYDLLWFFGGHNCGYFLPSLYGTGDA